MNDKRENYEFMSNLHNAIVNKSNGNIWAYFALMTLAMFVFAASFAYYKVTGLFRSLFKH